MSAEALARVLHGLTDGLEGEGTATWPDPQHREVYALAVEEVAQAILADPAPLLAALAESGVLAEEEGYRWGAEDLQPGDPPAPLRVRLERGAAMSANLLITMSEADAETFVADWLLDAHAPVLTGGHQENPVVVTGIAPIGKQGETEVAVTEGCPEGMYPTGTEHITYQNEAKDLAELREMVEDMLGPLNFPLGWWFSDSANPDFDPEADERHFVIVIWMPRKMQTWSVKIAEFDRAEVQRWLDTTIKESVNDWYGWRVVREEKK